MSIKSKVAAIFTFAAFTLSAAGQALAYSGTFTDLANISQAGKINTLRQEGYLSGTGNSQFSPSRAITAAEGIQLIVKAFKLNLDTVRFIKEPKATDYFKKADNNAWYAKSLIIASVNSFDLPADLDLKSEWTREKFTYYLTHAMEKYANLPMIKIIPIQVADENQMTVEFQGAIQRALHYGLVKVDDNNKFNPKSKITRAEAAEEVYNALEYLKAHSEPISKTN